ncbi:MAG: phage portal protein [Oscillospiraceae bacterium]|nr:phage portal protein [Oscillospiraceae bacterium]MBR4548589.1 phage portal protein [Oscillospiraceae bacterium]
MGLNIFKFLTGNGKTELKNVTDLVCRELLDAALDYQIRELSFWCCVNWIANAIGRCEVRTFREGAEIREREYYLWNVEPNVNQNSTAFWHKAVARLFQDNELLIVPIRRRDGLDAVAVADDWDDPEWAPTRQNEYRNVKVWDFTFTQKVFREDDVIHLKLNHCDMRPILNGLYDSYFKLVKAAMNAYGWQNGQHWKVHVSQLAAGADGWEETFRKMIETQIKPFLDSNGAVLPEFDGYKYENVGGAAAGTRDTRDIKALIEDIFSYTARAFGVADVLLRGEVEATGDAMKRTLTGAIDPICDQFSEEATRKRYGYDAWQQGSYLRMDSSSIQHFDLFGQAANIEKLLGSGWSLNDIRRAAGEQPINEPWADEHLITKNIGRLDTAEGDQEGGNNNG